jgi:LysR family transcriptional regulator, transcription activator of glutamate synthase operon
MELYQLEYFREIVASKNLHEASEKLHVSQPSLSRCIKALEEELDVALFDRVGRNLILNETGQVLLRQANITLDAASSIKAEVSAFKRSKEQVVNLYCPVPLGEDEKVFYGFKREHPDIRIRVGVAPVKQLISETPDLTFFSSPFPHEGDNYLLLGEEELVLVVPANSELAEKESVKLADFDGADFIGSMPSGLRDMIDGMFEDVGAQPHIVMENQSFTQVVNLVAMGLAYTIAPSVTWLSSEQNVVGIPLSDVTRKRYLYLKWPEKAVLSRPACLLRDYLVEHFAKVAG